MVGDIVSSGMIVCRLAVTSYEKKSALDFIQKSFWVKYQWIPPSSDGDIILAWEKDNVVGVVNLDFRETNNPFPMEHLYDISPIISCAPFFDRMNFVQGGRWSSSHREASRLLLRALAMHSLSKGREFMICETKDYVMRRFEEFGIKFLILYGLLPHFERLPEQCQKYYLDVPPPRVMIVRNEFLL